MTDQDICTAAEAAPPTCVVAVHMEAADLCTLSRARLKEVVREAGLQERVFVPADGDRLSFARGSPTHSAAP